MKLFRMKTLGAMGIGFLAGSRAGTGPWEKAQETFGQLKGKIDGTMGNSKGSTSSNGSNTSTSSNGFEGQYSKDNPQMTEV
jgi:hypothetical protein